MLGKGKKEILSVLFEYTETKDFENFLKDYCKRKAFVYNDVFHEGGRAGFILSMSMHFASKNKKTSKFLEKWIEEMAAADHRKREEN